MTEQLSVAVLGASGRMGAEAVKAIDAAADLTLVAALGRNDSLDTLVSSGAQIVVDLTVPESTEANVRFAVEHGMHAVVGTTGWDAGRLAGLEELLADRPGVGVLIAPNFALGSVLASAFAAKASKYFESVEIIELHHPDKVDAPSGTAVRTAQLISAERTDGWRAVQPGRHHHGARRCPRHATSTASGSTASGSRGLVAHQEVLLGGPGEQLTIRHDSFDRASFMPGVLLGIRNVAAHPGLTVGLDGYLDLGL